MSAGFLYVLINPTMPGLAKVGKTTRNPTNRVAELSSATGVPSPFMLAFQQPVADCDFAELWVHRELEREGFRHAENREFFNAPLHAIIKVVAQASNLVFDAPDVNEPGEGASDDQSNAETLALELFNLGVAHEEGTDTVLKNPRKALQYYEQAAALGHQLACYRAAGYYQYGVGVNTDLEKAVVFYNKLVHLGNWICEADLAEIFLEAKQAPAAQVHWIRFFEGACKEFEFQPTENTRHYIGRDGSKYCEIVAAGELTHCVPDQMIVSLAEHLLKGIENKNKDVTNCADEDLALITEYRLNSASIFILRLENNSELVSNGHWWHEADIAENFLFFNQKDAAQVHWKKFFEGACKAIESGSKESVDHTIGKYGHPYCVSVANNDLAYCVSDETIARLAEHLLQGINSNLHEVQTYDKELREFSKKRLTIARRFIEEKVAVVNKKIPHLHSAPQTPKWSFKNFFK